MRDTRCGWFPALLGLIAILTGSDLRAAEPADLLVRGDIYTVDGARFRQLEVVANFSPFWTYSDPWIDESTLPALGPERTGRLYPMQSFFDAGAVVSAGSDWPVSALNPFEAIQVGMTRQPLADRAAPSWIPEERATLPELLAANTVNGAYANHLERTTGSLESGKAADFIVVDRNLFSTPIHEIGKTRVVRTFLDGKEVYRADAPASP
jgi:predicted amidohydrolase YtcJ